MTFQPGEEGEFDSGLQIMKSTEKVDKELLFTTAHNNKN